MNDLTPDRIGDLVVEALERTAFVLAETVEPDQLQTEFAPTRFACIAFTGVAVGSIVLSATDEFVAELASSLLGVEPEEITLEKEGVDALSELANIVGGSIIIDLGGEKEHYEYGLPLSLHADQLPEEPSGTLKTYLESESGMLCVAWLPGTRLGIAA